MAYEAKHQIYLPLLDFQNLEYHLMATRPGVKPDAFVTELVQRWLKIEMERLALRKNGQAMRGFQWKNIFLPDRTNLRTSYHDTIEFAKVVGDRILTDDGESIIPRCSPIAMQRGATRGALFGCAFPAMTTGSVPTVTGRALPSNYKDVQYAMLIHPGRSKPS